MDHHAFHVRPKDLADSLVAVKAATNTHSALTALAGVRLDCTSGQARMYATNMTVHACRTMQSSINGPVNVVVSLAELTRAAKLLAKEEVVTIAHAPEDKDVIVRGAKRTIKLKPLTLKDFPDFPSTQYAQHVLNAPAAGFADAIKRSSVIASSDETRPVLTGVFVTAKAGERPELVATDSWRLSVLKVDDASVLADFAINVHAASLKLTTRGMKDGRVIVHLDKIAPDADPRGVFITNPAAREEWWVRSIDGQFPNYQQLLPEEGSYEHELRVPTAELRSAFELASAMLTKRAPARIKLDTSALVHGWEPDGPSFEELLEHATHEVRGAPATDDECDTLEIGVNPDFALDAAKIAKGDELTLRFITPLRPILWEDGDDRVLLMPVRLNV